MSRHSTTRTTTAPTAAAVAAANTRAATAWKHFTWASNATRDQALADYDTAKNEALAINRAYQAAYRVKIDRETRADRRTARKATR